MYRFAWQPSRRSEPWPCCAGCCWTDSRDSPGLKPVLQYVRQRDGKGQYCSFPAQGRAGEVFCQPGRLSCSQWHWQSDQDGISSSPQGGRWVFCCSQHPGARLASKDHQRTFSWDLLWALKGCVVACDENRRHKVGGLWVFWFYSPTFSIWWLPVMVPPQWSLCHG